MEESTGELQGLIELRHQLQEDFRSLGEEREKHRLRLDQIYTELQQKEQLITDKQRSVSAPPPLYLSLSLSLSLSIYLSPYLYPSPSPPHTPPL